MVSISWLNVQASSMMKNWSFVVAKLGAYSTFLMMLLSMLPNQTIMPMIISGVLLAMGSSYVTGNSVNYILAFGILSLLFGLSKSFFLQWNLAWQGSFLSQVFDSWYVGVWGSMTPNLQVSMMLTFDTYNVPFIFLTTGMGFWALLYSPIYMRGEPSSGEFSQLLFFFLVSMVLLLSAGNLFTVFMGWEFIGMFSFLLINFWMYRLSSSRSALKAFVFNKLSDSGMLAVLIILSLLNPALFGVEWGGWYNFNPNLGVGEVGGLLDLNNLVICFILMSAFCKSAQFGFHSWLPDSMEAPVPASSLIHSATLVSAGMFLVGRMELTLITEWVGSFLVVWGGLTACYGGVVAAFQTDLKKILAYSTISHCGFLFVLLGLHNPVCFLLYLHFHGWFKSYSFMAAGIIISKSSGYQDIRRVSGHSSGSMGCLLFLTYAVVNLGSFPFILGFFNKHYLLDSLGFNTISAGLGLTIFAGFTGIFYSYTMVSGLWVRKQNSLPLVTSQGSGESSHSGSMCERSPWEDIFVYSYGFFIACTLTWFSYMTIYVINTLMVLHGSFEWEFLFFKAYIVFLCLLSAPRFADTSNTFLTIILIFVFMGFVCVSGLLF